MSERVATDRAPEIVTGVSDHEQRKMAGLSDVSDEEPARLIAMMRRIAHELRTPLGVLGASFGQLTEAVAADSTAARMLEMSRRAAAQIERLADRLSLVARVERGLAGEMRASRVDLNVVAGDAVSAIQRCRRRRGVEIEVHTSDLVEVEGDAPLLVAAVAELVDNALRFARSKVDVRTELRDGRARVVVQDDGPGFDADARSAFGRRLDGEHVRGGLGVGSSLASALVEAHGGELRLERDQTPTIVAIDLPTVRW